VTLGPTPLTVKSSLTRHSSNAPSLKTMAAHRSTRTAQWIDGDDDDDDDAWMRNVTYMSEGESEPEPAQDSDLDSVGLARAYARERNPQDNDEDDNDDPFDMSDDNEDGVDANIVRSSQSMLSMSVSAFPPASMPTLERWDGADVSSGSMGENRNQPNAHAHDGSLATPVAENDATMRDEREDGDDVERAAQRPCTWHQLAAADEHMHDTLQNAVPMHRQQASTSDSAEVTPTAATATLPPSPVPAIPVVIPSSLPAESSSSASRGDTSLSVDFQESLHRFLPTCLRCANPLADNKLWIAICGHVYHENWSV